MTNEEILKIALQQSAYDCNCKKEDFLSNKSLVTISKQNELARKYVPLPLECDLVSYGSNIVAQTSERLKDTISEYISKYPVFRCFETPNINVLNDMLAEYNLRVCFMAEYFLPDVNKLKRIECKYKLRILQKSELKDLYTDKWSNAICEKNKELDKFAIGAYDDNKLIGLAGCSADCEDMYQIGVDVLPSYRMQGVASALTSSIAIEILALGKVPFYCAAWSNIKSVRNAIKCGFYPAWVELTARDTNFIKQLIS